MKLITKEVAAKLPRRSKGADPLVTAKFFGIMQADGWRWYAYEYDGKDICFGLVCSHMCPEGELGSFSISELESVNTIFGIPAVERDLHFAPMKLSAIRESIEEGNFSYYP